MCYGLPWPPPNPQPSAHPETKIEWMKIIINHFFTQIKTKAKPTGEIPLHQPFSSEIGPAANFCVANNPCPALGISDSFTSKPECASVNILTAWRPWMNVRHGVGVTTNAEEDLVSNIWFYCRFMRMLVALSGCASSSSSDEDGWECAPGNCLKRRRGGARKWESKADTESIGTSLFLL